MYDSRKRHGNRDDETEHMGAIQRKRELMNRKIEEHTEYDEEELNPRYLAEVKYFLKQK